MITHTVLKLIVYDFLEFCQLHVLDLFRCINKWSKSLGLSPGTNSAEIFMATLPSAEYWQSGLKTIKRDDSGKRNKTCPQTSNQACKGLSLSLQCPQPPPTTTWYGSKVSFPCISHQSHIILKCNHICKEL